MPEDIADSGLILHVAIPLLGCAMIPAFHWEDGATVVVDLPLVKLLPTAQRRKRTLRIMMSVYLVRLANDYHEIFNKFAPYLQNRSTLTPFLFTTR